MDVVSYSVAADAKKVAVSKSQHWNQEDAPTTMQVGDTWYVPSTGVEYTYINDGITDLWIDTSTSGIVKLNRFTEVYTATGGETEITVPEYVVGDDQLVVAIEGNVQYLGEDYTETSSTSITLTTAMTAGEKILIQKV